MLSDSATFNPEVTGEFVTLGGERYYAIHNVDKMAPFFISLVSDSDHWLFVASNGGLTAGRWPNRRASVTGNGTVSVHYGGQNLREHPPYRQ